MQKLILSLFTFLLFNSCQKDSQNPIVQKEIYIESEAIGNPIIKEIDEKGGVIDVEINEAQVIFPPNAVSQKTLISVQPISNTKTEFGLGIRISSQFRNIKIELKYPQNGIPPNDFELYFSQGISWVKAKSKIIDTVNHTISIFQYSENELVINSSARIATHSFDYVVGK